MLDLSELDDIICQYLPIRDLARCSLVNKQWNRIVAPYLWKKIPSCFAFNGKRAFCKIVLKDYLQERCGHLPRPSTQFSNNAYWIQLIPPPADLYDYFEAPLSRLGLDGLFRHYPDYFVDQDTKSRVEASDLMHHFLIRCSNIQVPDLGLYPHFTMEYYLPLVQDLTITLLENNFVSVKPLMVKLMLCRCSNKLKSFTFEYWVFQYKETIISEEEIEVEEEEEIEMEEDEEPVPALQLKILILLDYREFPKVNKFWSWLWRACGSIEQLEIRNCSFGAEGLARRMLTFMPKLHEVQFGLILGGVETFTYVSNKSVASILSGCRNGWREVQVNDILIDYTSSELIELLSLAPNLRILDTIDYGWEHRNPTTTWVDASAFIDLDPVSESLWPWASEGSLEVFKVKIMNIPRPNIREEYKYIEESYPGEGLDIQLRVYERLARFTRLEVLWLGYCDRFSNRTEWDYDVDQLFCLEMSLESGLDKLAGLKELRNLSISNMNTKVGLKEIKWMAENWPKLRIIRVINTLIGKIDDFCEVSDDGEEGGNIGEEKEEEGNQKSEHKRLSYCINWLKNIILE
ncbi:hypothetical protein BGZ46_009876 [Entomortierella lignicola]|nr:hypothetical protein BGZ46_009876 [Entomortierella lignicola]